MNFSIISLSSFDKQVKRLVKKYPSLKKELVLLQQQLLAKPTTGTPIGHNCYKIRIAIASKGKGKSGGARIITHIYVSGKAIFLLSIYDKSEQNSLSDKELLELLNSIR